jgi:signal transduction histidine kinase
MAWNRVPEFAEPRWTKGADVEKLPASTVDRQRDVARLDKRRPTLQLVTALFAVLILLCVSFQPAEASTRHRRIYLLEALSPAVLASGRTIDGFKRRLHERTSEEFDLFVDYMELMRLPSQAHLDSTVRYLSQKYAEAPPDLLITLGRAAIPFMVRNRDIIAPDVPTIVANVPSTAAPDPDQLRNVVYVVSRYDFLKTFRLAQQLQPKAQNVVIVGGASDYDRQWLDDARRELQPHLARYRTRYFSDLPYDAILREVSQLSKDTIVILSAFLADSTGQARTTPEVAADLARVSPAPVYSPVAGTVGMGALGGYADDWEAHGATVADVALEILSGKELTTIPRLNASLHLNRIDARQLRHWHLNPSAIPSGSEVSFREFDLWERYHRQTIVIITIVLMQSAVISWLILERRRRQIAETEQRQRLMQVIHLNRTALAGALSASVVHELNQPLGAIRNFAEAASLHLKSNPPKLQKVEQILESILRDDQRAADIIEHIRELLKRRTEVDLHEFDLNELVQEVVSIISPEALKAGVEISTIRANGSVLVRGDRIQLQQVVMNLAMNGIDAMRNCAPGCATMSIETVQIDDSAIEVSVSDSGVGIPPHMLRKVFETFYTTKRHGTGLGLSIARTIIDAYGGKLWAENRPGGGTVFRFTLPMSSTVRA